MQQSLVEPFPIRLVVRPKHGGVTGSRLFTILGPNDAARYRLLVGRVAGRIESVLSSRVHANRVHFGRRGELQLECWKVARLRFRRLLLRGQLLGAGSRSVVARADVRRCFEQINPSAVERALLGLGCPASDTLELRRLLEKFRTKGVPGLPVGPAASAVLANAVLSSVDGALIAHGIEHLRWVDDFLLVSRNETEARGGLDCVRESLASLGLQEAPEKTGIVESPVAGAGIWSDPAGSDFGLESSR